MTKTLQSQSRAIPLAAAELVLVRPTMLDTFRTLCEETARATKSLSFPQEYEPHYQRVLDYIHSHPDERDEIAALLARSLSAGYEPEGVRADLSLVTFLMSRQQWPEGRRAAESAYASHAGNHLYGYQLERLVSAYRQA
jgi:hypothetical protein